MKSQSEKCFLRMKICLVIWFFILHACCAVVSVFELSFCLRCACQVKVGFCGEFSFTGWKSRGGTNNTPMWVFGKVVEAGFLKVRNLHFTLKKGNFDFS